MGIKAVLFDLDGTLLPMDQDVFVKKYFEGLSRRLKDRGYNPEELIKAVWLGTEAMIKNNGENINEQVFWQTFSKVFGKKVFDDKPYFDEFYKTDFLKIKEICGSYAKAPKLIEAIKQKGIKVVLATNPIFPEIATKNRASWAGLSLDDFEYVTTYENCKYSKPNLNYYKDIAAKLGVECDECVMVGNDVGDDMVAKALGMQVFLLTDNLINKDNCDISEFPNGNFDNLCEFLLQL